MSRALMKQGTEAFLPTCPNTMFSGGVVVWGLSCGVVAASVVTCLVVGVVGEGVGDEVGMSLALSDVWVVIIWPRTEIKNF